MSTTKQDLHHASLRELSQWLETGKLSSVELTQAALARIEAQRDLNCFLCVDTEHALAQARASDARRAKGEARGQLDGLTLAHKDVFVTTDFPATAGSRMLQGYRSPFDATIVARLKASGAVCVGKTNMDEFAMGSSNENSAYGAVRNPWDTTRVPGGSSGGSAAAVAARLVQFATGSDTGGSIRQPASLSGVTGIKPTYGACSRLGMIAFASSLDQAGVFADSAWGCAQALQAMIGFDPQDATSIEREHNVCALLGQPWGADVSTASTARATSATNATKPLQGLRIGLPREYFGAGLDAGVDTCLRQALALCEQLGATLVDISLPRTQLSIPAYYIIAPAEASSNLARFDGVRYGHRSAKASDLQDLYRHSRSEGFGAEVRRRILIGTYVLSHGYYDAYYLQAQRIRRLIAADFQNAFQNCHLIAGPASPVPAWKLGEKSSDPLAMYLADIHTLSVSLAGLPGLSLPAGFTPASAKPLPVGLQLIGNYFEEARLLSVADHIQQASNWHQQVPVV